MWALRRIATPAATSLNAHERADDRFVDAFDRLRHDGGRLFDFGHRLRREDHDAHVDARVFQHGADGRLVAIVAGVADHVDRVAERSGRGQRGAKLLLGGLAQLGQLQAVADRGVGGHDARAAGIGDDRHPRSLGQRLRGIKRRVVEQFGNRIDPLHAALRQQGIVDRIGTGQRTGVAADRLGAFRRPARLQAEHRLVRFPEDLAGPLDELPAVGHVLQVHGDYRRVFVLGQVVQQIDLVHVGLVAEADELAEAHVAFLGVIEHRGAKCAALRKEAEIARGGHLAAEGGVHPHVRMRVDHAQAVGADQRNAGRLDLFAKFVFQRRAFRPDFLETGRNHHQAVDLLGDRLIDHAQGRRGRDDQHGQIHRTRHVAERGIGEHAHHVAGLGIDGINRAVETGKQQIAENIVAYGAGPRRGADHGDRLGRQDAIKPGRTRATGHSKNSSRLRWMGVADFADWDDCSGRRRRQRTIISQGRADNKGKLRVQVHNKALNCCLIITSRNLKLFSSDNGKTVSSPGVGPVAPAVQIMLIGRHAGRPPLGARSLLRRRSLARRRSRVAR